MRSQTIFPLLMGGTYLFLPLIYITLLSSPLFSVPSTSRETATTLITLILLIHIYTFGIGYLIHLATKRRKHYLKSLNGEGESLPMYNTTYAEGDSGPIEQREASSFATLIEKIWKSGNIGDDVDGKGEGLPMYNDTTSTAAPFSTPSPYTDANSRSNTNSLLDQSLNPREDFASVGAWEEWGSGDDRGDHESAARFEWEDQTPVFRPSLSLSSSTGNFREGSRQTLQEATGSLVVEKEAWGIRGFVWRWKDIKMKVPWVLR